MEFTPKRKSIFRILISRIFLSVFLFNLLAATYIILDEIKTENRFKDQKAKELIAEIGNMLSFVRKNLQNIEKVYSIKHEILAGKIENEIKVLNAGKIEFNERLNLLNTDTYLHQISIIKDGIVINSSNSKEIGINLFTVLNYNDSIYFQDCLMRGDTFPSRFYYDKKREQFSILSFYPAHQNRYIVGINSFSPEFEIVMEMFKFRLKEMSNENRSIASINFWFHFNNERIALLQDSFNSFVLEKIPDELARKDTVFYQFRDKKKMLDIKHYFVESQKRIYNLEGLSISIITDYTNESGPIIAIIRNRTLLLFFAFIIFFLIVYFSTRNLKLTLADLLKKTSQIGKGNLNERVQVIGNNEFTTLSEYFNKMVEEVEIAHVELKNRNEEISTQRDEIEAQRNFAIEQRDIIDKQKTNIIDSINYAKKIQEAVLPDRDYILKVLPESFIYFKPCSLVSGDFYWVKEQGDNLIVVAADSTGHGVPGAFMSILGITLLNEIVIREKITQPNLILDELRSKIKYALKQTGKDNEAQDGMDMTICSINRKTMKLQYAGAMNPLVLIRNNRAIVLEADAMPVGVYIVEKNGFTHQEIDFYESDTFYMFSDGFIDQIGGPNKRRFMSQNFRNLLLEISNLPMDSQMEVLDETFLNWKNDTNQLDDLLILGFRLF